MGKASRRKRRAEGKKAPARAPFVNRPFEGLANETDWVAMREIIPAATAQVTMELDGTPQEVTLVSVLPGAMPAIHRANGEVLVALQSRTHSGDASRDIVLAAQTALATEAGQPVPAIPTATADTPRLQDVLAEGTELSVQVQEDFNFWVAEEDATPEVLASLEQTNEAAVPTVPVPDRPSTYWCKMSDRTYVRWILGEDEDAATTALARLQAAGEHTLGEGTSLLGAFRAAGLLVPVLEVDPSTDPADLTGPLQELADRYAAALGQDDPLTPDERRARDGLVSRQVTLR